MTTLVGCHEVARVHDTRAMVHLAYYVDETARRHAQRDRSRFNSVSNLPAGPARCCSADMGRAQLGATSMRLRRRS
ncbi:MAG: hypothetical protein ACYCPT_10350 [Acidimicrobiales bacterium]